MDEVDLISTSEPPIEFRSESPHHPSTPLRSSSPIDEHPTDKEESKQHHTSVDISNKKEDGDDDGEHKDGSKKDSHASGRTNTYIGWTAASNRASPFPISKQRKDSGNSSKSEKEDGNQGRQHWAIFSYVNSTIVGRFLIVFTVILFFIFCYSILVDWNRYKCATPEGTSKKRRP